MDIKYLCGYKLTFLWRQSRRQDEFVLTGEKYYELSFFAIPQKYKFVARKRTIM